MAVLRACLAACWLLVAAADDEYAIVNIIRHGEKSDDSGDGLTVDGSNRATYLARCMATGAPSPALPSGSPNWIMAAEVEAGKSHRAFDTVAPLASALGLEVDLQCDKSDAKCFAKQLKELPGPSTVIVAWEHNAIPDLVKELNVPHDGQFSSWPDSCDSLTWPQPRYCTGSTCYDMIWQVALKRQAGKHSWDAVSIEALHEGFGGSPDSPCAEGLLPWGGALAV